MWLYLVEREKWHLEKKSFQHTNICHMGSRQYNFPKRKRHKSTVVVGLWVNCYLARAFELSFSKLIITISFTVSVSIACISTVTHHQTVFIQAVVPVIVCFFFLNKNVYNKSIITNQRLTSHWQTGLSQPVHPSRQKNSHGQPREIFYSE